MEALVEGLEVELDDPAGGERQLDRLVHQAWVLGAGCLPADSGAARRQPARRGQSVRHLARGVPAEEADAVGIGVGEASELIGCQTGLPVRMRLAEAPVLTAEAVERAARVEDGEVVEAEPLVAGADPVRDAVGRQRIPVPAQQTSRRSAGEVAEPRSAGARRYRHAEATEAALADRHPAGARTQRALNTLLGSGWGLGQTESTSVGGVGVADPRQAGAEAVGGALAAHAQRAHHGPRGAATQLAGSGAPRRCHDSAY